MDKLRRKLSGRLALVLVFAMTVMGTPVYADRGDELSAYDDLGEYKDIISEAEGDIVHEDTSDPVIEDGFTAQEGDGGDENDGYAGQEIIASYLHDQDNKLSDNELYRSGSYRVIREISGNTIIAGTKTVNVTVYAEDLRRHAAAFPGDNRHYWAGLGVPCDYEGWDVKYLQTADPDELSTLNNYVSLPDGMQIEDEVKYANFYYRTDDIAGTDEKRYLGVAYEKLSGLETIRSIIVYVLDFSNVTLDTGLPGAGDFVDGIKEASLSDNIADPAKKKDPVIEDYHVEAQVSGNNTININLTGRNLKKYQNHSGIQDYWLGVDIPKLTPAEGQTVGFCESYTDPGSTGVTFKTFTGAESEDYRTFYFKKNKDIKTAYKYYILARYSNSDGESEVIRYVVDASSVTFADELPAIGDISSVVNAPLVDRSAVPEEHLYEERSYSVEKGTPDAEHNIIPVNISADRLKVHMAGNGVSGNWVGFGIPEINDANVSANYCQSYTEKDPETIGAGDWKSGLDDVLKDDNEKITHRTVYFNAGDQRLVDKTGYVYVKYASVRDEDDYVIYTFVVDMNGVTLYGLPAENDVVNEIITSPLHDNETGPGALSDNELYDEGTYKLVVGDKDQDGYYPITVSAKNLRSHMNSAGKNAYWLGVSLPYKGTAGLTTEYSFRKSDGTWGDYNVLNESDFDHMVPQEGGLCKKYCGFYFDGKKYASKDFCFAIRYTLNGAVQIYKFRVNTEGVTFKDGLPELTASDVTAAPLVDQNDPDRILVSGYTVSARDAEDAIDVTVTGKSLLKHLAGDSAGLGYWAGIGIRVNEDENYTAGYYQSYEEVDDPENITGWKPGLDNVLKDENENVTHRTVYFNAADSRLADKTGYVYVKYSSKRYAGDVKIITFRVNFSGLGLAMANGANDIMEAELRDDTINPIPSSNLVRTGSYRVETASAADVINAGDSIVVPVTVRATDLVQHTVSGKGVGYWAGIALPASFESALGSSGEVGYYSGVAPVNEDTQFQALTLVYDGEQTVEGKKYNRFLLDVTGLADTPKKGYVAVRFSDGTAVATVTYEIGFTGVTLKKPVYDLVLNEEFTGDAGRLNPAGKALTVDLTALVSNNKVPVSGCAVAWESSDPSVARVAGSSNTDKNGKTTAVVTFASGENVKPGVAVITASISGTRLASLRYETYRYNTVSENVTLTLPGDSVYALTPTYELADGSDYAIVWDNDEENPDVVTVDNDGFVTAVNNGNAGLSQRIVEPASGKTVDRFGETDSEEDKLETPKGEDSKYKITVKSQLSSIAIRAREGLKVYALQPGEDVEGKRTQADDALSLELSPATYRLQGLAGIDYKIEWKSSNVSVATVSGPDLPKASVTGLKKGVTNITATVTLLSNNAVTQTVTATYVMKVYPSVVNIDIYKQGASKPADTLEVKKGSSLKLIADVAAEDPTVDKTVRWSTLDAGVAKVNDSGLVTAVSRGSTIITATTPDGVTKQVTIYVYENITAIHVDMANVILDPDGQISVNAITAPENARASLKWKTSNDKIVTVTPKKDNPASAVIKAAEGKTSGSATVTVTDSYTGLSATLKATIGGKEKELTELKADVTEYSLYPGNTVKLTYKAVPADYTNTILEWFSDNERVARVDANGLVTAIGEGETGITLKGGDVELQYTITVKQAPPVSSITIDPKSLTLTAPAGGVIEAGKALISVTRYPEHSELSANIVYGSDDEAIAKVAEVPGDNNRAVVTAVKAGTTTITAYCYKDTGKEIRQSISVTVTEAVEDKDVATGRYNEYGPWIGFVDEYVYTGSAIKPEPNVYYGSLKLTKGKDYTCSYSNNVNAARSKNAPTVTVKLKGNYKGSLSQTFVINPADIAENVTVNKVSGVIRYKNGNIADQLLKPVITYNSKTLKEDTDYQLYYLEDTDGAYQKAGEWTITIVGQGNFTGETYTEEILMTNGISMKNVKAAFAKSYVYTGAPVEPKVPVTLGGSSLKENEDYVITFSNNVHVGKATATVTGTGRYYGSKSFTFKVVPEVIPLNATADDKLEVTVNDDTVNVNAGRGAMSDKIPYSKGGTKPSSVVVKYDGVVLTEGVDYKWSNKAAPKKGTGKITITGTNKKNLPRAFKGKAVITYEIGLQDISTLTFVVDDFVYKNKADRYKKNKITVYDLDGKALKKDKDYTVVFETDDGGNIPAVGTYVTATITGKGFYDPDKSATVSFRVISKDQKLGNASLYGFMDDDGEEFKASKYYIKYAGTPVTLEEENIILRMKKKVGHSVNKVRVDPDQYEIVTIQNNNKVGKATVILRGTGDLGGLKTITFKIKK